MKKRDFLTRCCIAMAMMPVISYPAADTTTPLTALPFTQVDLKGGFWGPRLETNRTVSLPHSLDMLNKAGNIKDLELAAAGARSGYQGPLFIDSDLYKALEAISCSLATHPDADLEKRLDDVIDKIAKAQAPDGYLNTFIQVNKPDKRWNNLKDEHELYCAGHLMEAAVAHHRATGKRTLLDVATKLADNIDREFRTKPNPREGYCGHEEIELALYKLADVTGEARYRDLANHFLERRGSGFFGKEHKIPKEKYDGSYWQDDCRIRDFNRVAGHAVRAMYLFSAAADYAAASKDKAIVSMLDRVWANTTTANMYITGGIGPSAHNEGFTHDYDLPNQSAYQETCASVGMILWNHRLGLLHRDAKYFDVMERSLYNGFLAGVSLDGTKFFYVNPLASIGKHHRTEWYSCACCPPNVTRTLAQLGGYAYAVSDGALWVNLYAQGTVAAPVAGKTLSLNVTTDYPWDGTVTLENVSTETIRAAMNLRVPGWCKGATAMVNGQSESLTLENGYVRLNRDWQPGDKVQLNLPMAVELVAANERVQADAGQVAVQYGPVVYCVEQVDQRAEVGRISLPVNTLLTPSFDKDLLGGVNVISGSGLVPVKASTLTTATLYAPLPESHNVDLKFVPYYAWDNRTPGPMKVWLPTAPNPWK